MYSCFILRFNIKQCLFDIFSKSTLRTPKPTTAGIEQIVGGRLKRHILCWTTEKIQPLENKNIFLHLQNNNSAIISQEYQKA